MKLKNKKTGEVKEWDFGNWYQHIMNPDNKESYECTLSEFIDRTAEFRKEWEDVPEEPFEKDFYIIFDGDVKHCIWYRERVAACPDDAHAYLGEYGREQIDNLKSVGLYFETREEAELAVRKLKAWKRLKDKGFRFNGWDGTRIGTHISYISEIYYEGCTDDMDLLFGGEE